MRSLRVGLALCGTFALAAASSATAAFAEPPPLPDVHVLSAESYPVTEEDEPKGIEGFLESEVGES